MIWCVEDEASIRDIEVYTLKSMGFEARGLEDGLEAWEALQSGDRPELILLDVMLPRLDGVSLLRRIKADAAYQKIPVIMATAKGREYDKVHSLDSGADDYLVKPFGMMEMVSRIKAVLRRCSRGENSTADMELHSGSLCLDPIRHMLTDSGQEIRLTYKEFELLRLFMSRPGMVFSRDQLYQQVWGSDFIGESRTLDMHIRSLRKKLGEHGSKLETLRNVGYRWEA